MAAATGGYSVDVYRFVSAVPTFVSALLCSLATVAKDEMIFQASQEGGGGGGGSGGSGGGGDV